MATSQLLGQTAVTLMLNYPFWSELYYSMKVIELNDGEAYQGHVYETLATDGRVLVVCKSYWDKLARDLRVSAVAHEICHKMLHHSTRRAARDPGVWNLAADYVVNALLVDNGFPIGPGWVQPNPKYKGWSVEAVYNDLMKDAPSGGGGDGGGNGSGRTLVRLPPGAFRDIIDFKGTPEEVEAAEAKTEEQVERAIVMAREMGNLPRGVDMAASAAYVPKEEPWYNHLHRYMQAMCQSEYNWARMNKRYAVLHRIVAPANTTEALGEVVLAIDASGSCFDVIQQANFTGHINAILAEAKPQKVHVIYFETEVTKHEELEPGAIEFVSTPRGGGGTDFRPIFRWIEDEGIDPAVSIVLTDGYGSFGEPPTFPVVWAMTHGVVAPFGESIQVK